MNLYGGMFIPSEQLRERRAEAAKVVDEKPATKAVEQSELSALSEAELEYARKLAADDKAGLARLYVNGRLVRVGLTWQPGGEELWNKS